MNISNLIKIALPAILSIYLLSGCGKDTNDPNLPEQKTYTSELPRAWMQFAYDAVKKQGWFALDASRFYAYSAITAYESMVHSIENGQSLAGQLHGLPELPEPEANVEYNWGIVICHAMPQVMEQLMPTMASESRGKMELLARQQEAQMRSEEVISEEVLDRSKSFANLLAAAIINWSKSDGRNGMENLVYTPPSRDGNPQYWDGSTLGQSFMMPFWWTSRPLVVSGYSLCNVEPPYQYSESPNSPYYKDVKEVYDASFDPAKVAIGRYWANNPGLSGTPAGSWLGIANQLVTQYALDLPETLQMYVTLAIGTRDAFIITWYEKYKYNLQRPVSYIRNVMGYTTWESPVPTPPYPDYTSGTSVNAGVSSEILTRMFGVKSFEDSQHSDKGMGTKLFSSFKEAGREAFHSRIYGGVHMRRACEKGFEQGECIAGYIMANLKFKKQ